MTTDPRDTITPDAFTVAPELLGTPLARPWQRGAAMAIDLVLVSLMIKLIGTMIAAVVAVLLFLRLARPDATGGRLTLGATRSVRFWIVLLLCFFTYLTVRAVTKQLNRDDDEHADDDVEWENRRAGIEAADSADIGPVLRFADALETGDTAAAAALRDSAEQSLAGVKIAALALRADSLDERAETLEAQLAAKDEGVGVRRLMKGLGEDFGVGFGWMAVYFTAFLVLWKGQTPGKRIMRTRVIRLDGRTLTWWMSFERFGGYAASFSIGLLGFLQILWDRNRQGLHDKAVETVVIRL